MQASQIIIKQQDKINYRFQERDFDLAYWHSYGDTEVLSGGRGASQKIQLLGEQLVLRRYLRGGLIAKVLYDQYLWLGLENSRPYQEQRVSQYALKRNLPVAKVVAFCVKRTGLFYRAVIITLYIPNQGTLASFLSDKPLDNNSWSELGRLIRKFHRAGIFHADLNANNILIDLQNSFHVIDFDKAKIKTAPGRWQKANLERLLRSLRKIQNKRMHLEQNSYFTMDNWQSFLEGYGK